MHSYSLVCFFLSKPFLSFYSNECAEDKANAKGGRWLLTCANQDNKLDELWLETLLGMIGDCFSHDTYVIKT